MHNLEKFKDLSPGDIFNWKGVYFQKIETRKINGKKANARMYAVGEYCTFFDDDTEVLEGEPFNTKNK